jgi:hypothetical protein
LAIGGEAAFGTMMATVMRFVATHVQEAIVPDSGHWIMEESPSATIKLVDQFTSRDSQVRIAVQSARLVIATCQW